MKMGLKFFVVSVMESVVFANVMAASFIDALFKMKKSMPNINEMNSVELVSSIIQCGYLRDGTHIIWTFKGDEAYVITFLDDKISKVKALMKAGAWRMNDELSFDHEDYRRVIRVIKQLM